jgi:hypothetical protein
VAHITLLDLSTVRLGLQEFVHMCAPQRGEVIRICKDNQVTMHVINSMVSRSSTLMGRTPASPKSVARVYPQSGDAVPPLNAESLCGPIVPATPRIRRSGTYPV